MLIILILTILKIDKRIIGFFLGLFLLPVWGLGQPALQQKVPGRVSEQSLLAFIKNDPNTNCTGNLPDNTTGRAVHFYGGSFSGTDQSCYFFPSRSYYEMIFMDMIL